MLRTLLCSAVLICSPICYAQEGSLASLGLSSLQRISDQKGAMVRGSSSTAYSMSVASGSALLYDPETGSQVNIDVANFANSSSDGVVNERSTAASEAAVGLTGLNVMVGNRSFQIGPMAVFSGGQGAGNGSFGVLNLNVPRFNR